MNHNRRKILNEQENEIPDFDAEHHLFGRVLSCRSGDIFEVEYLPKTIDIITGIESDLLLANVRLPSKFKHVIWAKTGDLVILAPEDSEFSSRTLYYINAILAPQHIKSFIQQRLLPSIFIPDKFAHKSYSRHESIQTTTTHERFLHNDDDSDDDLPEINNYKKKPFQDSSDDDDDNEDSD